MSRASDKLVKLAQLHDTHVDITILIGQLKNQERE